MGLFIYGLIGIYALLMSVAAVQQISKDGFRLRAILFLAVSTGIVFTLFLPNKDGKFVLLIVEFILIHVLALAEGLLSNERLRYRHHVIRFIFHCALLVMVYKFIL